MIHVDNARLRGLFHARSRLTDVAKALSMHYGTFKSRLDGKSEWTVAELNRIETEVGISLHEFVIMNGRGR